MCLVYLLPISYRAWCKDLIRARFNEMYRNIQRIDRYSEKYKVATCVCRKDWSKVVLTFEKTRTAKQMLLQWIINRKCTIFVEVQETFLLINYNLNLDNQKDESINRILSISSTCLNYTETYQTE